MSTNANPSNNTTGTAGADTASRVLSGAMSLFGSPGSDLKSLLPIPTGTTSTGSSSSRGPAQSQNPDDIPKEELLQLCIKMNKRMQSMEHKGQELMKRQKMLVADRRDLIALVRSTLPDCGGVVGDESGTEGMDMASLKGLFSSNELRRADKLRQVEQQLFIETTGRQAELLIAQAKYNKLLREAGADSVELDSVELDGETLAAADALSTLQARLEEARREAGTYKEQVAVLTLQLDESQRRAEEQGARQSVDGGTGEPGVDCKPEVVVAVAPVASPSPPPTAGVSVGRQPSAAAQASLHRQVHAASGQIAQLQLLLQEKDNELSSQGALVRQLKGRIETELHGETERLRERCRELERQLSAGVLMKAEQEQVAQGLRREVRALSERLTEATAARTRLEAGVELAGASAEERRRVEAELDSLRLQMVDQTALVTRLRAEAATNEKNYALKTTVLAGYEVTVADLREEIVRLRREGEGASSAREDQLRMEARHRTREAELEEQLEALRQRAEKQAEEHVAVLAAQREEGAVAAEAAGKELAKRSSLARIVIQEKEEELRGAQSRIRELTAEVQSGAPGERRIMALAESQARRDLTQGMKK